MKVKVRFTSNEGKIQEFWMVTGQQIALDGTFNHKPLHAGTFEIMEIQSPSLPKSTYEGRETESWT